MSHPATDDPTLPTPDPAGRTASSVFDLPTDPTTNDADALRPAVAPLLADDAPRAAAPAAADPPRQPAVAPIPGGQLGDPSDTDDPMGSPRAAVADLPLPTLPGAAPAPDLPAPQAGPAPAPPPPAAEPHPAPPPPTSEASLPTLPGTAPSPPPPVAPPTAPDAPADETPAPDTAAAPAADLPLPTLPTAAPTAPAPPPTLPSSGPSSDASTTPAPPNESASGSDDLDDPETDPTGGHDHPMGHLMHGNSAAAEASRRAAAIRAAKKAKARKIKIAVIAGFLVVAAVVGPPLGKWLVDAINETGNTTEEPAG